MKRQKNATPTREQQQAIERAGLNKAVWVVTQELDKSLIIKHRITGEFKLIRR